ncbi:hypothetical protein ACR79M_18150 [Sphingobacterium spiritivorum]|uniref:hypothetical protein n=2 Tax=Sphingobacteriaceae TaxID=84566 RepID=UPI001F340BE0|nr:MULTISPECIES: hypothetical protein [Sphingobacterium]
MFSRKHRKVSALICFFIFFTKMMISATPIFSSSVDKDHILQVVLQIEIENNAKAPSQAEDHQDSGSKYFSGTADITTFSCPETVVKNNEFHLWDEKHICAFHPSVPTPPPNC